MTLREQPLQMKLINAVNTALLTIGTLSLFDIVTFALGALALISAIIMNIGAWRKHNAERKTAQAERKLIEQKLKDEQA